MDYEEKIELLSWIKSGKQRKKIILSIEGKNTPTQITKDTRLQINHVSKILLEFRKKGIVELINPDKRVGRLYRLTEMGEKLKEEI
jgi:DNA-binding MarR family transcriptional regulator